MIVEKAYAKINLALEVKAKREDGYHEVNNLMVPIDLYDELTFEKDDEIKVISNIEIENNFIDQAARLFFNHFNISGGVKINLTKNIPIAAGLAGGSSDAAACLRGLNRLYETNATLDELAKLSSVLGSDMPFCIYQKLALCTGRGEKVNLINIDYPKYECILIKPNYGLSTKKVYNSYKYDGSDKLYKINNIINGLKEKNLEKVNLNIFNDLETPSCLISAELPDIIKKTRDLGYNVKLSGSGPTLFLLGEDLDLTKITKMVGINCFYYKTTFK